MSKDPVFYHPGGPIVEGEADGEDEGYYFWNEDWSTYQGPWPTKDETYIALHEYEESLG